MDTRAITMYIDNFMSLSQIAQEFGVSRQAVKEYLNRQGVSTAKGQWYVHCTTCGIKVYKPRCRIRGKRYNFCSSQCYYKFLTSPDYAIYRDGRRLSKLLLENHVTDATSLIVYPLDGDPANTTPSNLLAFKSQSDYRSFNRFRPVVGLVGATGKWEEVKKSR